MDKELDADFYIGDYTKENIAIFNPRHLKGFKKELGNVFSSSKLVWQKGAIKAAFSNGGYKNYILTGNAGIKSNWLIMIIARLLGRKVWLWTHGLRGNESRYSRIVNILYMRLASGLLFYSERGAGIAEKSGISRKKINVIYNSLDYFSQVEIRKKIGDSSFLRNYFGNDLPYVLFLGRLTAQKKVGMILSALKSSPCNIVIVGDGPERDRLEKLLHDLEMEDKVWFYGECYDEQMTAQFIYHSSLLISPGNIGLSAIHAMTYGTIPITHNDFSMQMPEVEAVVQLSKVLNKNLLFDENDGNSLRTTVEALIPYVLSNRDDIRRECYNIIETHWNADSQISLMKRLFGM